MYANKQRQAILAGVQHELVLAHNSFFWSQWTQKTTMVSVKPLDDWDDNNSGDCCFETPVQEINGKQKQMLVRIESKAEVDNIRQLPVSITCSNIHQYGPVFKVVYDQDRPNLKGLQYSGSKGCWWDNDHITYRDLVYTNVGLPAVFIVIFKFEYQSVETSVYF